MIEEATVDAYCEGEQAVGFLTMLEEHLEVRFKTTVFDVPVIVRRVDITQANEILRSATTVAIGRRFRFCRCRCRSVDQRAGSGSRPIDGGRQDGGGNAAADPRR